MDLGDAEGDFKDESELQVDQIDAESVAAIVAKALSAYSSDVHFASSPAPNESKPWQQLELWYGTKNANYH